MKFLKPVITPPKFSEEVQKKILDFFLKVIFQPIVDEIEKINNIYFNSGDSIESAVRSGKITYSDGVFKGDFNAALSKQFRELGYTFDKRIGGYKKELNKLPVNLQVAITQTSFNYLKMKGAMLTAIDNLTYSKEFEELNFMKEFSQTIGATDKEILETAFKDEAIKEIGIKVELTTEEKNNIAKEYSENLKLYIKDFTDKEILALREEVQKTVFSGVRADSLQKIIQAKFKTSESKAKFLAKQEISLLTSKYKYAKYESLGFEKYKWSISGTRTRPDHRALNGKIFYFSDPPITNQNTGARNNPGEDYNCDCIAIPIKD